MVDAGKEKELRWRKTRSERSGGSGGSGGDSGGNNERSLKSREIVGGAISVRKTHLNSGLRLLGFCARESFLGRTNRGG
ncbi:hypothetical protein ISN44_As05g029140 [Arabidopsis suecica]|uniref:Uncharacterized protein n=1 Tax=Arabidopsis suecica TaxID=45249 RepID=A0A8T2DK59_ARASU|nr:hypothetical protein ISN44_As05g029140 [Arabidopsis suecica]